MHETIKFCVLLKCNGVSVHFHSEVHMLCVGDGIAKLLLSLNVKLDSLLCESSLLKIRILFSGLSLLT